MVLAAIDRQWQQHLEAMEELREGVHLSSQGQKDPLVDYKNEAYELFVTLMDQVKQEALHNLFRPTETERSLHAPPLARPDSQSLGS
jgi:preprotein translocase subunit SecA